MTVAPELPPAPAARRRGAEQPVTPPARAARRHPSVRPAHAAVILVPSPRPDMGGGVLLAPAPGDTDRADLGDGAHRGRWVACGPGIEDLVEQPGEGGGREHRPAAPVRLRPVGVRVVRPARPRARLTRRGRVVAAAALLLATLTTSLAVTERMQSLRGAPVPATAPAEVVVAPGETLWTIAERVAPDRDPRDVVDRIRRLNGLPSGDVQAGQTLRLRAP